MTESPQEIRQKTFSVTRRGYDRAEVASYLAALAADLSGSQPDQIRQKTFLVTRRGYDKAEVASYLARIAHELEEDAPGAPAAVADDTDNEDAAHRAFVAALTDDTDDDPGLSDDD